MRACAYVRECGRAGVALRACSRECVRVFVRAFVRAFVRSCVSACGRACFLIGVFTVIGPADQCGGGPAAARAGAEAQYRQPGAAAQGKCRHHAATSSYYAQFIA